MKIIDNRTESASDTYSAGDVVSFYDGEEEFTVLLVRTSAREIMAICLDGDFNRWDEPKEVAAPYSISKSEMFEIIGISEIKKLNAKLIIE